MHAHSISSHMPFAKLADLDVYYERAGAGAPLLFISGTGSDLRVKPNVMDGPFAKNFDVVAYDQRGLGRTSKPDKPYAMADYADDAARLMEFLGWQDTNVVGVSFGGMVAQEFVLRHPKKVRRLVLCCTSPGGEGGASFPFHEIDHMSREERARHMVPISDTRRDAAGRRPIRSNMPNSSQWVLPIPTRTNRTMRWGRAASSRRVPLTTPGAGFPRSPAR